ncbi:BspA family leucine-rich repeat surface protein [archaeon]|nr:MAG: BspA family leucine-rich repeat surface protein [archaeon]
MSAMFQGALVFNHFLGIWQMGRVNAMHGMFRSAKAFNQSLEAWAASRVVNMDSIFLDSGYAHKIPQRQE